MYTKRRGLIQTEHLRKVRENHDGLVATGVHQAQSREAFHILFANFSKNLLKLIHDQCVATAEDLHKTLMESDISYGEMFGIVESENMYQKRDQNVKDINLIKFYRSPQSRPWRARRISNNS